MQCSFSTFDRSEQNLTNLQCKALHEHRHAMSTGRVAHAIDSLILYYSCSSVIPKVHAVNEVIESIPTCARFQIQDAIGHDDTLSKEIIRVLQRAKWPIAISAIMMKLPFASKDVVLRELQSMIADPNSIVETYSKQRYRIKSHANKALRSKKTFTKEQILAYLATKTAPVKLSQIIRDLGAKIYQETYNVRNLMASMLIEKKVVKVRTAWYVIAGEVRSTPTTAYTAGMVLDFVREAQRPVRMKEIVEGLGAVSQSDVDSVRNLISRMAAEKKLSRVGYGLYAQATEESTFVPRVLRIQSIFREEPKRQFTLLEITNLLMADEDFSTEKEKLAIKRVMTRLCFRSNSGVKSCGDQRYCAS